MNKSDVIEKWPHFSKIWPWRYNDDVINLKPIVLKRFGVPLTFSLGVRQDVIFAPPCKPRWLNSPCKVGLNQVGKYSLLIYILWHDISFTYVNEVTNKLTLLENS